MTQPALVTTPLRESEAPTESHAQASSSARGRATSQSRARADAVRAVALVVHRYVGLVMAVFLVVAGLTGSLIAFNEELDHVVASSLFRIEEPAHGKRLGPFEQREALQRALPQGVVARFVYLQPEPGVASRFFTQTEPGVKYEGNNEFFVHPYTGEVLGSRRWGDITQGAVNLMPFLYRLHYSLALGEVGSYLFGVIALLWTLDCLVGAYLTLPAARRSQGKSGARAWLARWKPAWLLRGGKIFAWVFSWHRASGLWVWAMLLVFAWSGVGFNLTEVYEPAMKAVWGMAPRAFDALPKHDPPRLEPVLDYPVAHRHARELMAEQAAAQGFSVLEERRMGYDPVRGAYRYQVRSSLDISNRYPSTTVWMDGDSGELLSFEAPTGQNAGRTLTNWLYQLHFGAVGVLGSPFRVFVSLMGLAVAALSVTGVWIWWVKRRKRSLRRTPSVAAP